MQAKSLSVICPIYNESTYIASFIESILVQDYPKDDMEILLVDGMSTDDTRATVQYFVNKYDFIKFLENPDKIVSHALNIGIKASVGKIIIRVDAHCLYPANYFSTLVKKIIELNADNVGGLVLTKPGNSSTVAQAISIAMSNIFGVGNSLFRIGSKTIKDVDTVPFGCFRRSIFDRIGYFDTDLIRNQDDEFNARIIKNGGKIYLIPSIEVTYFAREKVSKIGEMFYQYGLFKPLVFKKIGGSTTLRQFFPLIFVSGLILGFSLSFFFKSLFWITGGLLILYCLLAIIFSAFEAVRYKNIRLIFLLPYVFFVIHLSYGWGYLVGIFRFLLLNKKSSNVNVNR